MILKEHDLVRLKLAMPAENLSCGAVGTIVMVYDDPLGYEVEFCDNDGMTVALVTLSPSTIEGVNADEVG